MKAYIVPQGEFDLREIKTVTDVVRRMAAICGDRDAYKSADVATLVWAQTEAAYGGGLRGRE